jgi:hypothetical protein
MILNIMSSMLGPRMVSIIGYMHIGVDYGR